MEIINIANSIYTNYLLRFDKDVVLVDCGNNISLEKVEKKLQKYNIALEDIKVVILTHVHADHVSYMEDLLNKISPKVVVGKEAVELLQKGEDQFYSFSSKGNRKLTYLAAKFRGGHPARWHAFDISKYNPIIVDKEDDTSLAEYGIKLVPLPGHTQDSIGFIVGKDFIVGDAIMNSIPAKHLIPLLIHNAEDFKNSYKKLIEANADKYYPGHGAPLSLDKLKGNLDFAMQVEEL